MLPSQQDPPGGNVEMTAPGRPWDFGPATNAARRAQTGSGHRRSVDRGYPHPAGSAGDVDTTGESIVLAVTRALLEVRTRAEAVRVLHTAVTDLGGGVVPARLAGDDALPVDVSLGVGEPMLAVADVVSIATLRLSHHLPMLVHDAALVAARCDLRWRLTRKMVAEPEPVIET